LQRIGLFGGTFDPVHNGHLQEAREVVRQLALDQLVFIPAPHPPHKTDKDITSFAHRLAMLELATGHERSFIVSLIELERQGPSYTIDTLTEMRSRLGRHHFYFIIGLDAFVEINTWKDYRKLLASASFAVIDRPFAEDITLEQLIADELSGFRAAGEGVWRLGAKGWIFRVQMPLVAISSTGIREKLMANKFVANLVPEQVARYIEEKGLYR